MKALLGISLSALLLTGCHSKTEPEQMTAAGKEFQGLHLLRQIVTVTTTSSHLNGSYFLIAGSINADSSTETNVTFAWRGNDGVYRFQTLPLSKIRIQIDEHVGTPFVKFRWASWPQGNIIYAVIGANPKDWPQDLAIPSAKDVKESK